MSLAQPPPDADDYTHPGAGRGSGARSCGAAGERAVPSDRAAARAGCRAPAVHTAGRLKRDAAVAGGAAQRRPAER
eukprot:scaffold17457_cov105-Isochrysis_galbana.AAC.19